MNTSVRDIYYKYCNEALFKTDGTKRAYTPKINSFTNMFQNLTVEEIISETTFRDYIDNSENKQLTIPALKHFYKFVSSTIHQGEEYPPVFPIDPEQYREQTEEEDDEKESNGEKVKTIYLNREFDLKIFFDDDHFKILKFEPIIVELKACIAMCIGAAFGVDQLLNLRLDDIIIDEEKSEVRVKNLYESPNVKWITINDYLSRFIKEYYNLRIHRSQYIKDNKDFFGIIWTRTEARNIEHDPNVLYDSKVSDVIRQWIPYILKHISNELGYPRIYTPNLRENSILHYLYNTNGTGMSNIIRTFGFISFVRKAIKKYLNETVEEGRFIKLDNFHQMDDLENGGINREYFFSKTTSDDSESDVEERLQDYLDAELPEIQKRQYESYKRLRNNRRVRELKQEYKHSCQVCGEPVVLFGNENRGVAYSEVCHIIPHGEGGLDDHPNMLVLCPNHHVMFDLGIFCINPMDKITLLHIDQKNSLHKGELSLMKHDIDSDSLLYHYKNIFSNAYRYIYQRKPEYV